MSGLFGRQASQGDDEVDLFDLVVTGRRVAGFVQNGGDGREVLLLLARYRHHGHAVVQQPWFEDAVLVISVELQQLCPTINEVLTAQGNDTGDATQQQLLVQSCFGFVAAFFLHAFSVSQQVFTYKCYGHWSGILSDASDARFDCVAR